MEIALPPANRVLVVAPHPDDESLGCGGTIARYTRNGIAVALLVVSDGGALDEQSENAGDLVARRAQETMAAAAALGVSQVDFLGLPDGQLAQYRAELAHAVRQHLTQCTPDLIFCPSPIDGHPDHAVVARVLLQLHRELPGWTLAFYELHTPLRPNWLVNISEVLPIKEQAVLCYQRSLFGQPHFFWETVRGLNQARSFFVHQPGFFEALWVTRAPLTDQEVIEWSTFDFHPQSSEDLTLRALKGVDECLFLLKERSAEAASRQQQIETLQQEKESLQQQLHNQAALLASLQQILERQNRELQALQHSFTKWVRQFCRRYMDRRFPVGTRTRAVLRRLNRLRLQYTSKSPSE
ncbi:MAG TPA: PIG-L family deacetylase [Methylomirabilota bacterium]|nr:PIG-L family deacetylase [Methylomirabilota bacterium]